MPHDLLATYTASADRFDELFVEAARPRPHWARMFETLAASRANHLRERLAAVERQVREQGIAYSVYADPQGNDRPWDIDPLPMIVPAAEWQEIEAAVQQRAGLLNALLADVYGPQRLLREGLVPPELVFGHSGFLRPAQGMRVPGGVYLHVYAADLSRAPDGRWWVMADRTQAPAGAGYALEHRLLASRVFPDAYRDLQVAHLADFFATLRDSLAHGAPRGDGPVRAVVLTPGPFSETYFEHSLIARYLGYPLVEGADLTVRDGKVWLKTLDGLQRVHAILRRLDEAYCDPLELRPDSALGVPGITECLRQGTVLLANALGSGVLESGSLLGYLPRLAQELLGEPLKMPSVATWWCGEPAALADAFEQVESLVFTPANPADRFERIFGADLSKEEAKAFRERVLREPGRWVAHEVLLSSQAPVLDRAHGRRLTARPASLRVFAVATPSGYAVMPGGLTRVASTHDERVVPMQRGGQSKDTWVLSTSPVGNPLSLLRSTVDAPALIRQGAGIPSRVAENLFWFGRYTERCETAARLLRVALGYRATEASDNVAAGDALLVLAERFSMLSADEDPETALLESAFDESRPFGLASNLRALAQLAFTLRERLSLDNWRVLTRLTRERSFDRPMSLPEALNWLDHAIVEMMTLSGFAMDGMTRDTGWRFLSIGRRLERVIFECMSLEVAMEESQRSGLTWLLELSDSIITYRSRYMTSPEWLPVLDLLVVDETNPRSVAFQVKGLVDYFARLEPVIGPWASDTFEARRQQLQRLDPTTDLRPESPALVDVIDGIHHSALELSERLTQAVFGHSAAKRLVSFNA